VTRTYIVSYRFYKKNKDQTFAPNMREIDMATMHTGSAIT
jgi:hypothetical protein